MALRMGIDPGFRNLGLAVVDTDAAVRRLLHFQTAGVDWAMRPEEYCSWAEQLLGEWLDMVEGVGMEAITFFAAPKRGRRAQIPQQKESEVWTKVGAMAATIATLAHCRGVPVRIRSAQQIKAAATGGRNASKDEVIRAVRRVFPDFPKEKAANHAADAVAAAITCWAPELWVPGAHAA